MAAKVMPPKKVITFQNQSAASTENASQEPHVNSTQSASHAATANSMHLASGDQIATLMLHVSPEVSDQIA
jgi:hypothetical protein